jgi:protease-4
MDENSAATPGVPPSIPLPTQAPPLISPPPRRPKSGGGIWMALAIVLFVLLVISILGNFTRATKNVFASKGRHIRSVGPRLEEVIVEDNQSSRKIVVIDVTGIITSRSLDQSGYTMVDIIKAQLRDAEEDPRVKAVILKVDSPGGEVLASDEIYRELNDFQLRASKKPLVASMGNLAASGGYYVSAPCQWIVANEMTITGSIGVIMHSYNYRGLMNKVGLFPEVYKSGKYKDMLSGEREPEQTSPEERQMVQHLIDETYQKFQGIVGEGREAAFTRNGHKGRPLADNWKDFADGRVLSGREALDLGFVDQLGNFQDAVKRAEKLAGIENADLIKYQQRFDLSDFFKMFGQGESSRAIKVDLGLDAPKLQTGQLYFLSPTFAH